MYASFEDVEARYGPELYALAGTTEAGEIDPAPVARALEEATSEIDVTLQGRYGVPFAPVPAVLRRICIDLAVATLPRNGASEASLYERRAKEARTLLQAIGKGEISLGSGMQSAPAKGTGLGVGFSFPQSGFRQKLEEF